MECRVVLILDVWVLASHPKVFGAGERLDLRDASEISLPFLEWQKERAAEHQPPD
jgi:hypothetical protein